MKALHRAALALLVLAAPARLLAAPLAAGAAPGNIAVAEPGDVQLHALMSTMSIEDKVGQMIMSYPPKDKEAKVTVGAVVLTRDLLRDEAKVRARIEDLQRRATVPLLVAVDMEGGRLNRLHILKGFEKSPSAQEIGAGDEKEALEQGRKVGAGMKSLGMNCNLAPVLDMADRGTMHEWKRSLGVDPEKVSRIGKAYAQGLWEAGVVPIAKHFPGYGMLDKNSDFHVVITDRSPAEVKHNLRPFMHAGPVLGGVLMANVAYKPFGGVPAILSGELVTMAHDQGWLTVTDDLSVEALAEAIESDPTEVVRRAFLAGNDILLTTAPIDWEKALDYRKIVIDLVKEKPELEKRLDDSVLRVLRVKQKAGLLKPEAMVHVAPAAPKATEPARAAE